MGWLSNRIHYLNTYILFQHIQYPLYQSIHMLAFHTQLRSNSRLEDQHGLHCHGLTRRQSVTLCQQRHPLLISTEPTFAHSKQVRVENQSVTDQSQGFNLTLQPRHAEIIAYIRWRLQLESQPHAVVLSAALEACLKKHHSGQPGWCMKNARRYWASKREFVSEVEISSYPPAPWAVKISGCRAGQSRVTPRKVRCSGTTSELTNPVATNRNLHHGLFTADNAVRTDGDSSVGGFV